MKYEKKLLKKIYRKKDSINSNVNSKIRFSPTIRIKLIVAFIIPIAFIIFLGVTSYEKAAESICNNYEQSTKHTINMTAQYIDFGVDSMEALATQYIVDDTVLKYLRDFEYDKIENSQNKRLIGNTISAKEITDKFISDISIFSDKVLPISTLDSAKADFYKQFVETDLGKKVGESNEVFWIGKDSYLDENIGGAGNSYSLRLLRKFQSENALLVIDMDMKTIQDILNSMEMEQTGIIGFVTADGKEIISTNQEYNGEYVFYDKEFYQNVLAAEQSSNSLSVEYQGEDSLFISSKIGNTGAMICVLIPESIIIRQADSIKQLTFTIVIIACIIAILTGFLISTDIDRTIRYIISKLKKTSSGDLCVDFTTKRRDEFRILISEINNTFINVKELILQVKEMSKGVSEAGEGISDTSEKYLRTTQEISVAMDEIEQGITQLAKDAEECLYQMDSLSNKIILMSENTKEIEKIGEETKQSIQEGTIITERLTGQTQSTILITTEIVNRIDTLEVKSQSIGNIISAINEISNQTNLLSLNASIEAARAGEIGKGFSVVANEIRKLSVQTKESVDDIKQIIESIQSDTKDLAKSAKNAENVLVLQEEAVRNTTDSYQQINQSVDNLTLHLKDIIENVSNVENARVSTLGAVENISAVLEEIAASTNNVNLISNGQLSSIEALNQAAGNLSMNSNQLMHAVSKFKV